MPAKQLCIAAKAAFFKLDLIPARRRKLPHVQKNSLATRCILAAGLLLVAGQAALAADRWEEGGSGAVAILPAPKPAAGITGGSFYCSQQRWAFLLRLAPEAGPAAGTTEKAKLTIADQTLDLDAEISAQAARLSVPADLLLALKEGTSLRIEIGAGKTAPKATFNLRSSKLVIEAIAPRCSQIDMSAFERVTLSETDAAVPTATGLLADEIKLFRQFTSKDPVVATKVLELADGKRLMFASLCGSTNYFGDSGCSLTGYAAEGADGIWRMVYETEGVLLHLDPKNAVDGWPNLVTLPVIGGTEPTHWAWSGEQYQLLGQAVSEGEDAVQEQGDSAQ